MSPDTESLPPKSRLFLKHFSTRVATIFRHNDILSWEALAGLRFSEMMHFRSLGEKSRREVCDKLHKQGLTFLDETEGGDGFVEEFLRDEALFNELRRLTYTRKIFTAKKFEQFLVDKGYLKRLPPSSR